MIMEDLEIENENMKYTVQRERKLLFVLEESITELTLTIDDLEKRYDSVDDESNEWKTRFEIQTEINEQLNKQILLLQDKIVAARRQVKDIQKSVRANTLHTDFGEMTPHMIEMLEEEKESLIRQRKDLDWRIDQESKAYYRASEERKGCQMELATAAINIHELKSQTQRESQRDFDDGSHTARSISPHSRHSPKRSIGIRNIPQDQRILNIRKGPIKKTAAIRNLPAIQKGSQSRR